MGISEVARRDIIDFILLRKQPFYGRLDLITFLKRIWSLSTMPSRDYRFNNAEGDIWQHMVNNSDWTDAELLYDRLDLLTCDDATFLTFVEQVIHPVVVADDEDRRKMVDTFNKYFEPEGYVVVAENILGTHPLYKAIEIDTGSSGRRGLAYEVVLSFAGEDREYVEKVATYLKANGVRIFYDKYEEATLWGKDLAEHLDQVYRGTARYCVMFISKYYGEKIWTNHERRSALTKAIQEKAEYILPARFDDTEIPGIRPTVGYISLTNRTPEELGKLILQKLGRLL
jgi:hypothetical protein